MLLDVALLNLIDAMRADFARPTESLERKEDIYLPGRIATVREWDIDDIRS